jgi:hypothetical protein
MAKEKQKLSKREQTRTYPVNYKTLSSQLVFFEDTEYERIPKRFRPPTATHIVGRSAEIADRHVSRSEHPNDFPATIRLNKLGDSDVDMESSMIFSASAPTPAEPTQSQSIFMAYEAARLDGIIDDNPYEHLRSKLGF